MCQGGHEGIRLTRTRARDPILARLLAKTVPSRLAKTGTGMLMSKSPRWSHQNRNRVSRADAAMAQDVEGRSVREGYRTPSGVFKREPHPRISKAVRYQDYQMGWKALGWRHLLAQRQAQSASRLARPLSFSASSNLGHLQRGVCLQIVGTVSEAATVCFSRPHPVSSLSSRHDGAVSESEASSDGLGVARAGPVAVGECTQTQRHKGT